MRKRDREWGRREKERISEVGVSIRVAGLGQKLRLRYGLEVGSHGLERETMLSRISDQPTNISFFTYVGPPSSKVSGSRNNFTTARVWRSTRSCFEKRVRIDREKYEMGVAMTSHCDLSQNLFHSIHSFLLSLSLSFLLSSLSFFFPLSFFLLRFSRQFDHRSRDYRLKLRSQWLSRRAGRTRDRAIATPPFSAFPLHVHHYFTRRSRSMRLRSHGGAISTETRSIFPFCHPSSETDGVARAPLFLSIDVYVDNYVSYSSSMDNIFFSFFMTNIIANIHLFPSDSFRFFFDTYDI